MKILMLSHFYHPHIGGVEKHVEMLSKELINKNHEVNIITEKFDQKLKSTEILNKIKIFRIKYSKIKFIGLLTIWKEIYKLRKLVISSDVIHIHDVFIWYLPFRFLFPTKKVFTTIHGLEWDSPFNKFSLIQKKLAVQMSDGSIGIGKFLEKYIGVKFTKILYGGTPIYHGGLDLHKSSTYLYVGRLEENTGLGEFLKFLEKSKFKKVDFVGDGRMRKVCEKFGEVHGFCDPTSFYKKTEFCVPAGYLAAFEALNYGCKIKLFWSDKTKEDYWKLSPFYTPKNKTWFKNLTWEKIANEYISLYTSTK